MKPYYADGTVTLYLGDMRDVLPALDIRPDCIVTDPPYDALRRGGADQWCTWDVWPPDWLDLASKVTNSMWCFGTLRALMRRAAEFESSGWRFSHDVVWSKGAGTGTVADRFRPSHELVTHWYRGSWPDVYHDTPRLPSGRPRSPARVRRAGESRGGTTYHDHSTRLQPWEDDGLRYALSVIEARNLNGRGIHPTEKPVPLLDLLIRYACPPGGTVLDVFAGSGAVGEAARMSGRRAVLIEGREDYCEAIAKRLQQDVLPIGT